MYNSLSIIVFFQKVICIFLPSYVTIYSGLGSSNQYMCYSQQNITITVITMLAPERAWNSRWHRQEETSIGRS
jgi:hypothetical protein